MKRYLFLLSLFCAFVAVAQEKVDKPEITSQELKRHIKYLSSDELKGRKTGEEGNRVAAKYIAHEFERYGLSPAGDKGGYFQEFPFLESLREGKDSKLTIHLRDRQIECR